MSEDIATLDVRSPPGCRIIIHPLLLAIRYDARGCVSQRILFRKNIQKGEAEGDGLYLFFCSERMQRQLAYVLLILAFIHHAHGVFEASNEEFDFFLTILTDLCREYIMQHESASWKEFKWWMVNTIGGELEYHEFFNDVGPFCFDSARTQLHLEWLNGKAMRSESVLSWTLMSKKLRSATQEIL